MRKVGLVYVIFAANPRKSVLASRQLILFIQLRLFWRKKNFRCTCLISLPASNISCEFNFYLIQLVSKLHRFTGLVFENRIHTSNVATLRVLPWRWTNPMYPDCCNVSIILCSPNKLVPHISLALLEVFHSLCSQRERNTEQESYLYLFDTTETATKLVLNHIQRR